MSAALSLIDRFIPDSIRQPEARRRARLLVGFSWAVAAFMAVLVAKELIYAEALDVVNYVELAGALVVGSAPLVLLRTGSTTLACNLVLGTIWSATVFASLYTGGIASAALWHLGVLPLMSVAILGRKAGFFWTLPAALTVGGFFAANLVGYNLPGPEYAGPDLMLDRLVQLCALLGVLLVISLLREASNDRALALLAGTRDKLKLANAELQASELKFRSVAECLGEGLFITDLKSRIVYANRKLGEMTGYPSAEMIGLRTTDLFGDGEESRRAIERRLGEQSIGRSEVYEVCIRRRDGHELWVEVHAAPCHSPDGEVTGRVGAMADITERRNAREQLRQAQKMEAIGQLAGGVAHDFNNLLTVIGGHADLLARRLTREGIADSSADEIRQATRRGAELTRQLLAFSRKPLNQPIVLDLNEVVEGMTSMLERLLGEQVSLVFQPADGPVKVLADRSQLEQVIVNLVVNARDAVRDDGKISLATDCVTFERATAPGKLAAGEYALLKVSDDGRGIEPENRERIFEPFYTTKTAGEGTGLGLAIVHGIVQQARGHVRVRSRPGEGSTFEVYLPRAAGDVRCVESSKAPAILVRGGSTILLVEDEEVVRSLEREILESVGNTVLEAVNGVHALEVAAEFTGTIDLLLTDLVMPLMGGQELARRLTRQRPGMRVLFVSGYAGGTLPAKDERGIPTEYLQKPFVPDALLEATANCLEDVGVRTRFAGQRESMARPE